VLLYFVAKCFIQANTENTIIFMWLV